MQLSHYYKEKFWEAKKAVHEGVKYSCRQCENQTTNKNHLAEQKMAVHERVKYPYRQCNYQATWKGSIVQQGRAVHEGLKYSCRQCVHEVLLKKREMHELFKHNDIYLLARAILVYLGQQVTMFKIWISRNIQC